ncbi:MAG: DUF4325 domain-containing protein [Bacteroidales bacterium]|nr:DUF4325 domain-containing protein [Bacteroidales bacterium]
MNTERRFKHHNCWMTENILRIGNLTNQRLIPEFIISINRLVHKFNHKHIILDFEEVDSIYPYPTTALAGIIHYFSNELGVVFELINVPGYLKYSNFQEPILAAKDTIIKNTRCLDHFWKFKDSTGVYLLVEGLLSNLRRAIVCEPGIFDAVSWGLNEVMDNVIQHSEAGVGFVSAAVHKQSRCINICVYDYGIGIYRSLKKSKEYNPRTAADAISLAVKEGVTRDKSVGQGNGMWGLYNIVNLNAGKMSIISGRGGLSLKDSKAKSYSEMIYLNRYQQATTVSFHLNLSQDISIRDALGGHDLVDLYLEEMEDDYERIVFKLSESELGVGTRESGELLRTEVKNIVRKSGKPIIIDFGNIGMISSSFADEFLGKLIVELGFFQYQKIFTLVNMNETVQSITQRSISLRMAQSLGETRK